MNREEIVNEIITYPLSYALMWGFLEDGKWFKEKLLLTDLSVLKNYLYDMKTIEKNKKELHG